MGMEAKVTPSEIYNSILEFVGYKECTICSLHKPCKNHFCANSPQTPVIDFDEVETLWHSRQGKPSTASADALGHNQMLCFIELKGWKEFLNNNKRIQQGQNTEKDREFIQKGIKKQVDRYNFEKKLTDSIRICEEISGVEDLIGQIPISFILVTDINPQTNPLEAFNEQLNMLAATSGNWEEICYKATQDRLYKQIQTVKPRYIYCEEFEKLMNLI